MSVATPKPSTIWKAGSHRALPDTYISPNAKWSAAGGAAVFGNEIGFGANLAIRGNKNWSMGASTAFGGDQVTGKVQVRYEGF